MKHSHNVVELNVEIVVSLIKVIEKQQMFKRNNSTAFYSQVIWAIAQK